MASFAGLLSASDETLLKLAYHTGQALDPDTTDTARFAEAARLLDLNVVQFTCALGFRADGECVADALALLGLPGGSDLQALRDHGFVEDVYEHLRIRDLLTLYGQAAAGIADRELLLMLLPARLRHLEARIEAAVNPMTIERYKKEVRAFYGAGLASIAFAHGRLADMASGFRALTGEAVLMAEHRVFDIESLFNLQTLQTYERKRLFRRGHVPREMLVERLARPDLPQQERVVLEAELRRG